MCCNSSCTGQKSNEIKVNANLFFTLPSKLLILIIDHEESCFFSSPPYPTSSLLQLPKDFQLALRKPETACSGQNLFFLPNKASNNPVQVGRQAKKHFNIV